MATISEKVLGVGESSDPFVISGSCDLLVEGLTAGSVKLQYLIPASAIWLTPTWVDFPDQSYTADVYKTVFMADDQVSLRLTGVANNAGVRVRFSRRSGN